MLAIACCFVAGLGLGLDFIVSGRDEVLEDSSRTKSRGLGFGLEGSGLGLEHSVLEHIPARHYKIQSYNPNPATKQHAIASITHPTHPEKFIRHNVVAPFLQLPVVIVALPKSAHTHIVLATGLTGIPHTSCE